MSLFSTVFVQVDLFSKTLLLVPVHLDVHWCLVTANVVTKKIYLYDSQGNAIKHIARVTNDSYSLVCDPVGERRSTMLFSYVEYPGILDERSTGEAEKCFHERLDLVVV